MSAEQALEAPPVASAPESDARREYSQRHEARARASARQARRDARIADARLAVFVVGLLLSGFAYFGRISWLWLIVPALALAGLVAWHARAARARKRADRATAFYENGLARLDETWAGRGEPGTRFLDEGHPYAADLDLFGAGSLFERLCTARTPAGQATLAAWLLAPAAPEEIRARQEAVEELRPQLDLREDLALLGDEIQSGIDPETLAEWGSAPPILTSRLAPRVGAVLAWFAIASLIGWFFVGTGPWPFALACALDAIFALWWRTEVREAIAAIEERSVELDLLAELLARIEREPFAAPRLRRIVEGLGAEGLAPSAQIGRLARLVSRMEARDNQLFAPIAALMLWATRTAFAIDAWRAKLGPSIGRWMAAVGEVESLAALSAYAFENPDDPFPTLVEGDALFEGEGLGHPLIPACRCIRNDLALGEGLRVLVVSGSNMSGKSTLLRTVGVNAVLAQAGAPVRARGLRFSPLAIGATLRVQDSLQAGRSRFFAEITRVRQVVDLARGPTPLLFLLDEIFNGTNSHDRRIGAEAVVCGLIDLGAIGLVTTHDLALAEVADRLAPRASNVHFEDRFEGGAMTFDYTMRPGVVRNSNALALMRAVGLEV